MKEKLITDINNLAVDFWTMNLHNGTFESHLTKLINDYEKAISVTRCSTQLLCVEKGDDNGITRGYEYKCINQDKDHYKIIDNYGCENWFLKEYFTKIK